MVNGRKVTEVALNPGDVIQIGSSRLTFRSDGAAEPTRINRPT
jgi:pSer/pThr/pTyr-binding forkhead associated (FHA) protein